jgi:polysaccharide biosynthesis transport protein
MASHPSSPSRGSARHSWHPTDYLRVLYKRRWVAIPGFLLIFLTGTIDSIRTVPIYEARTQLLIEKDARRATSINTVLQDQESYYNDDFYPTQYKMLQSRTLAARTVEALERNMRPEQVPSGGGFSLNPLSLLSMAISGVSSLFSAPSAPSASASTAVADAEMVRSGKIDRLIGSLSVVPVQRSRLVDLRFRSPDPEFAMRAVNELANQYVKQSLEYRFLASQEASDFLSKQLEDQRKQVEASDAALQQYKESHNAASVDDKQNLVVQKLTALNAQVLQAKFELVDKEGMYSFLLSLEQKGAPLDTLPAIVTNDFIQKLKGSLAGLREQRAQLVARGLGEGHRDMVALDTQIKANETQLQSEMSKVAESIKADYSAAQGKVRDLEGSLNAQKAEAMGLDRKLIEYTALEREADSNRKLYDNLLERSKETGVSSEFKGSNIQIVDRAEYPRAPVLPRVQRDLVMSGLGGILLALGLAFGFEYFDSRIKSPDEVKAHLELPFLGMVPLAEGTNGEAPMLQSDVSPAFAESIRSIRTAVLFSSADEGARSIIVTSTGPHEGKTLIASSLAITMAQAGQRTLVVDADMRRPRMHEALGRSQEPGLSNVLVGDVALADATRPTAVENLWVLAAGHIPPNPAELLGSRKYDDLFAELKRRFDWIVIDAPPVMPVTDAALLAHSAGGVVFVVGSEMTPRQSAVAALDQLRGANAKFVGVVLNRVNVTRHSYYYSPYYRKEYGKYYQRSPRQA